MDSPPRRRRPWLLPLLGVAAFAGLCYAVAGYAMAGSFAAAHPGAASHWRRVAAAYAIAAGASAAVGLGVAFSALRRRRAGEPRPEG